MTGLTDELITALAADLKPVRRLHNPAWRALVWTAAVMAFAALLASASRLLKLNHVSAADGYVALEIAASVLTAFAAALAAFELSLPDRSHRWVWLPIAPVVFWIVVSGLGCLGNLGSPGIWGNALWQSAECLLIILGTSVPVSGLLLVMLRRALPLRPAPVASMAGLATAGASASLLVLVHPHDSAVLDLVAHGLAVTLVVAGNAKFGRKLMQSKVFCPTGVTLGRLATKGE